MSVKAYKVQEFIKKPITRDYRPSAYHSGWMHLRRMPAFNLRMVTSMITDARILFGLWLLKGPILSKSRFFVRCEDKDVKDFLIKNITRFWRNSAPRALKALDWGYSCNEVLYKYERGHIHFDVLKDLESLDCKALTIEGKLVGARVSSVPEGRGKKGIPLPVPKLLWHVHSRETHPWYGRSRLYGAYWPWTEIWTDGGFRDSRRLYFHKYAYSGGFMYHPVGDTRLHTGDGGLAELISNKELAREMLEKMKTGAVMALPNTLDDRGQRQWEYAPPQVTPPPVHVMEYGDDLRSEMWEGMGIPPEVAKAEGTGAYAGRAIPMEAFYAALQELVNWLITDTDEQIFRPLVEVNFGKDIEYEIIPFGLLTSGEQAAKAEQEMGIPGNPMVVTRSPATQYGYQVGDRTMTFEQFLKYNKDKKDGTS